MWASDQLRNRNFVNCTNFVSLNFLYYTWGLFRCAAIYHTRVCGSVQSVRWNGFLIYLFSAINGHTYETVTIQQMPFRTLTCKCHSALKKAWQSVKNPELPSFSINRRCLRDIFSRDRVTAHLFTDDLKCITLRRNGVKKKQKKRNATIFGVKCHMILLPLDSAQKRMTVFFFLGGGLLGGGGGHQVMVAFQSGNFPDLFYAFPLKTKACQTRLVSIISYLIILKAIAWNRELIPRRASHRSPRCICRWLSAQQPNSIIGDASACKVHGRGTRRDEPAVWRIAYRPVCKPIARSRIALVKNADKAFFLLMFFILFNACTSNSNQRQT